MASIACAVSYVSPGQIAVDTTVLVEVPLEASHEQSAYRRMSHGASTCQEGADM